jgi:membrane protein DedA with SNARE-associated domain/membrane-associated phospholipid phosphatase
MTSDWLNDITTWIGAHPVAAGGLIFLVAFCDALAVVGIVVPALPLLFAVGTLIGLGHIDGPYAVLCAAVGAFAGDALSYWLGWRWGPAMRQHWLFRRYPQFIDRGERLFRKHGSKGIIIARFVGAVRPFVPAVAGMLHVPLKRYAPASAVAAVLWAASFLAPGWIFGASYDAVAAVADRLALVLLALVVVLALVWAVVLYTYRWFAGHADRLLARALKWTHAHPHLGRYAAPLIQANRPESAALAMLAMCLTAIGWGWFALLAVLVAHGGPLGLDLQVNALMATLRNPLADRFLAALASIGDLQVLLPAMVAPLVWLLWRKRFAAALHWIAALAFGFVFTAFLGLTVDMPRPPTATSGFGFPSIPVTMITIVFGFFAVLIARELPGRARVWPYLVSGAAVALLGFARLYFGAHWLSDIVGGALFGILWLLVLGIAYRRHIGRSFWMRPLATLFYAGFLVAALWHAPRAIDGVLAQFAPPPPTTRLSADGWWNGGWARRHRGLAAGPAGRRPAGAAAHDAGSARLAGAAAGHVGDHPRPARCKPPAGAPAGAAGHPRQRGRGAADAPRRAHARHRARAAHLARTGAAGRRPAAVAVQHPDHALQPPADHLRPVDAGRRRRGRTPPGARCAAGLRTAGIAASARQYPGAAGAHAAARLSAKVSRRPWERRKSRQAFGR